MNEPAIFDQAEFPKNMEFDNFGRPRKEKYLHNIYGFSMAKATYEGVSNLLRGKRGFVLSRSAYPGIQRFGFVWSGDNHSDWDDLKENLAMALNMGICGEPYIGADIGGFFGSPSDELYTRWVQLGAFIPFMRNHTDISSGNHESYKFKKYLDTIKKYHLIRYKLMPYLYTSVYETHSTGIPIVRPLFLEYGKKYALEDRYFLFGEKLLVCPILDPGITNMNIDFPPGIWYDYHYGNIFLGTADVTVSVEDIPVYIKGGSIIPHYLSEMRNMDSLKQNRDITFIIYPDTNGAASGEIYEDDGESLEYQNGNYLKTILEFKMIGGEALIILKQEGKFLIKRKMILKVPSGIRYVNIGNEKLEVANEIVVLP